MKAKKILTFLLALVMVLSFFGCGAKEAAPEAKTAETKTDAPKTEETKPEITTEKASAENVTSAAESAKREEITVAIPANLGDYTPFGVAGGARNYIKYVIYDYLAISKKPGSTVEELDLQMAKSITRVDNRTFDIEIYDYIYDSVGNHITADDVVFSLTKSAELKNNAKFSSAFDYCEKTGDYSVRLGIDDAKPGIAEFVIVHHPIISKAAWDSQTEDKRANYPIGAGPYVVTEAVPGSHITFEKNENYWQKDPDKLSYTSYQPAEKITFMCITETSQRAIALETGLVDIAQGIGKSDLANFMNDDGTAKDGYTVQSVVASTTGMIMMNCTEGLPTADLAVRQAICYAIDQEGLMKAMVGNNGILTKSTTSPTAGGYLEKWNNEDYYDYSPEKAKELLAEAGYKEGELSLRILTAQASDRSQLGCGEIIQAYLSEIGIKSEILMYDNALYTTSINDPTAWDILIRSHGSADYIIDTWSLIYDGTGYPHGMAEFFYYDDTLQELYEKASNIDTFTEENIDALHRFVTDNAFAYGLYIDLSYIIAKDYVSEIAVHPWAVVVPQACIYK